MRADTGDDPYAGRTLGGFKLQEKIGRGGMASVYLAHKTGPGGFDQLSAVKVVHPHLALERGFMEMFMDEARIAAMVNHPNVCRVFDFGHDGDTYYLAMEHLTGETWASVVGRALERKGRRYQRLLPVLTAAVLSQVCEGLHAAHEARGHDGQPLRIVHRDVSPKNVFVTYDGTVRVLDFGIASAVDRLHATRTGTIKGNLAYMAPEQMKNSDVSRQADIWSVGVMLWEAMARQRLFRRGTDAATMLAVDDGPPSRMPGGTGRVAPSLVPIAYRALDRDPDRRFRTAREMGDALSGFVAKTSPMPAAELSRVMHELFEIEAPAEDGSPNGSAGHGRPVRGAPTAPPSDHAAERQLDAEAGAANPSPNQRRHSPLRGSDGAVVLTLVLILLMMLWALFDVPDPGPTRGPGSPRGSASATDRAAHGRRDAPQGGGVFRPRARPLQKAPRRSAD